MYCFVKNIYKFVELNSKLFTMNQESFKSYLKSTMYSSFTICLIDALNEPKVSAELNSCTKRNFLKTKLMKKFFTVLFVLLSVFAKSQVPQKMSYQAVVRNNSNALVVNHAVGMRISILQGSVSGSSVYTETLISMTNANGLTSLEIGSGNVVSGNFSQISWADGPFFIKTETDPTGGTNYSITGVSQLLSVPFALYAANSGTPGPQGAVGPQGPAGPQGEPGSQGNGVVSTADNGDGTVTFTYTDGSTFTSPNLHGPQGAVGPQGPTGPQGPQGPQGNGVVNTTDNGNGTLTFTYTDGSMFTSPNLHGPQGAVGPVGPQGIQGLQGNGIVSTTDNGNGTLTFTYTDGSTFTSPNLHGPQGPAGPIGSQGNQGIQGPVGPAGIQGVQGLQGVAGINSGDYLKSGDGRVVLYSDAIAYGFGNDLSYGSGWYSKIINGPVLGAIASDSNIVLYTSTTAYGFGKNNSYGSSWSTVSISAVPTGYAVSSGRIVIFNSSNAYGFGFNSSYGSSWYATALSGLPTGQCVAGNRIVLFNSSNSYGFGFNGSYGSSWYSNTLTSPIIGNVGTR